MRLQEAELTRFQGAQLHIADTDAPQLFDQVSEVLEHGPNLLVPALNQADLVPRVIAAPHQP